MSRAPNSPAPAVARTWAACCPVWAPACLGGDSRSGRQRCGLSALGRWHCERKSRLSRAARARGPRPKGRRPAPQSCPTDRAPTPRWQSRRARRAPGHRRTSRAARGVSAGSFATSLRSFLAHMGAGAIAAMPMYALSAPGPRGYVGRSLPHHGVWRIGAARGMTNTSAGIVTYRGAVYASHCDHIGHMNIVSYGAKFDEANWVFFCEIGLTPSYLRSERYGMAGVQQNITYKQELFAGDVIEIRTQVLEVGDKRMRVRHEMRNIETGTVAAVSEITSVHLDKQAHKSCEFPAGHPRRGRGPSRGQPLDARPFRARRRWRHRAGQLLRLRPVRHGGRDDPARRHADFHGRGPGHGAVRHHPGGLQRLARDAVVAVCGLEHRLALPGRLDLDIPAAALDRPAAEQGHPLFHPGAAALRRRSRAQAGKPRHHASWRALFRRSPDHRAAADGGRCRATSSTCSSRRAGSTA